MMAVPPTIALVGNTAASRTSSRMLLQRASSSFRSHPTLISTQKAAGASSFRRSPHYHLNSPPQIIHNCRRRLLSSNNGNSTKTNTANPAPSSSSSSSASAILQNLAIFAVAGTLGYGAVSLFNGSDGAVTVGGDDDRPVAPSAPITSRVYFDVSIQNQPSGRIVIGLYGSTTPKTAHNFETLCKGSASANGRRLR